MQNPKELKIGEDIEIEKLFNFFPKNIDINDLRVTDISLYSITKRDEANLITQQILKFFPDENNLIITDSTACIGGNSLSFAQSTQVNKVNCVEIEPLHCDILLHNFELFEVSDKINIINDNYLNVKDNLTQDIIFYDLPWGGTSYRDKLYIDLYLNDNNENQINLSDIVNEMKIKTRLQVVKVPCNFNFTEFFNNIQFNKIKINRIYNKFKKKTFYYIILLFT